ncbi:MAG: molybdopterin adenylyltransferase [Methylacidiphilales bacterium]|nr:molybdopterin adenylyltransferase [Candidatus Methylacidiphilales bacterium]
MKIARITLSDRASSGIYEDLSGPAIEKILAPFFKDLPQFISVLLPDERKLLAEELRHLADVENCPLILTTGGTGPAPRDITPEATRDVLEKELPGFGEIQRVQSFAIAPTSILSRATAGIRGRSLIVNLPGNPKAVAECLPLLLPAIRECLKHLEES